MGERTGIQWTNSTWNPVTGCTAVTRGCDHCYAADLARGRLKRRYLAQLPVVDTDETRQDPFAVRLWSERLEQPRSWILPRMIFTGSMTDLFHKDIPDEYLCRVFEEMLTVDRHIYQVLTKRPSRALRFWRNNPRLFNSEPLPQHIWIGTSIEDQDVHYRVSQLRQVPATVRFLSCEPLLAPLQVELEGIHWVIVGGESGPRFRPLNLDWARSIRDQCLEARVPFFFKQIGGRTPKAAGRTLDGRTWDEFPPMTSEWLWWDSIPEVVYEKMLIQ